uniref:8.9 kDa family member n=1 Tax=Rhipicephalus zambeziensis TaxID=60191 RepID=A0A224YK43_9ACAR
MVGMKSFGLYCMVLCVFANLTNSMRLRQTQQLCTRVKTCNQYSRVSCLYINGQLARYQCVQGGISCEYPWQQRCIPPLRVSCQQSGRHCACGCAKTVVRRTTVTTHGW